MPLCRVPKQRHWAKYIFAECQKKGTRQRRILPSAEKWHSAKYIFAECRKKHSAKNTLQSHLCRVFFLPSVFYLALGKDRLCRVPDKIHSAKPPALGKVPVSGSECQVFCPYPSQNQSSVETMKTKEKDLHERSNSFLQITQKIIETQICYCRQKSRSSLRHSHQYLPSSKLQLYNSILKTINLVEFNRYFIDKNNIAINTHNKSILGYSPIGFTLSHKQYTFSLCHCHILYESH